MDEVFQSHASFDHISLGLDGDAAFYVEEARRAGSPILELGSGSGRVLIALAEAGLDVVGVDSAAAVRALARQRISRLSPELRQRIEMVEGDMRSFSLGRRFNLVLIPYRAFLHLLTPEDECRALACVREHLPSDGRLAFNVSDPRLETLAAHLGPLGPALKRLGEYSNPATGRRFVVWDSRQYDPARQILVENRIFEELDEEGRVVSKRHTTLTVRYVYRFEMQHLLELSGFAVEALYGDFRRGPYRYGGEQIWVARRKPAAQAGAAGQ